MIKINPSPQVTAKASVALAKIMSEHLNNVSDALRILEDARALPIDAEWMERISDAEAAIQRTIPAGVGF